MSEPKEKDLPPNLAQVKGRLNLAFKIILDYQEESRRQKSSAPFSPALAMIRAIRNPFEMKLIEKFFSQYGKDENPVTPPASLLEILGFKPAEKIDINFLTNVLSNRDLQTDLNCLATWLFDNLRDFLKVGLLNLTTQYLHDWYKLPLTDDEQFRLVVLLGIYFQARHGDVDIVSSLSLILGGETPAAPAGPAASPASNTPQDDGDADLGASADEQAGGPRDEGPDGPQDERAGGDPDQSPTEPFDLRYSLSMAAAEFFEDQFQCDLSKFEPVSAIWSFIVSLYPLIALLKDDGEFNALRFDPYFNDISEDYKNITRQINRIITETAIPLIEESRDEFSDLAKEDDIPWRQLDPFSRSLINLVAADAPHFHKLCLNFYAKFMEDKKTTSEKIFNFTVVAGIILLMIGIYLLTSGTAAPALAVGAKAGMIALLVTDCVGFTFQYFEEKQNETYNRIALVSQSLEELKEGTLAENVFYYFLTLLIMHYLFKGAGRLIREFKARKIIATEIPELKKTIESFGPEHVSHAKKSIDADIRSAEETLKKLAAKGPAVAESPEPGKLGIFSTLRETVAKDPAQNPRGLREGSIAQSTKDIERLHKKFDADLVAMAKKLDINLEQTLAVADRFGFKDANMLLLLELDFETAQLKRFLNVKKQLLQLEAEIEKTKQELDSLRKSRQALKKKSAPHKQAGHDIDQKLAVKKLLLEEKSKLLVVLNFLKGTRTPQSLGDWGEQLVSSESNYLTPLRRNVAALDAFTRDNLPVSVKSIFLDELATYSLRKDPYFAIVRGEGKIKEAVNLFINNWDLAVKEVPTSFVPPRYLPPKPESIDKIIHLVYVTSPPPPAVQAAVSEALSAFLQEEAAAYKSIRYSLRITYKSKFELFSAFKPEQVKQLKTLVFPKAISLPGIGRKKPAQED